MLINFSIKNFGPVKDEQVLSFEATRSTHLEDTYVINSNGLRLLKVALIYGANASGKTTILNALDFLRNLVLEPAAKKTDKLDFQPFLFDEKTPGQNTIIRIECLQMGTRYLYQVECLKKAIISEELYYHKPNKANVFKRRTDLKKQFTEITFGNKIKRDKTFEKILEANTLWNNTVLGGYLKTNIDLQELQDAIDWFRDHLNQLIYSRTELEGFVTSKIEKGEIATSDVINILKKADFNISGIMIGEEKEIIPRSLTELFDNQFNIKFTEQDHKSFRKNLALSKEQIIARPTHIEFEHTVNNITYPLPLELESHGTRRYYGFAGILALLIKTASIFPVDELEASLHPDLYLHFLLVFLLNAEKSQIIATTHNRELLDNKDLFRNDAIWFTDKQENGSTDLYSLADFDSSVVRNTTNVLNAYKIGKLRGTPNLRDAFIDLNS